jgi:hypothetical protein
MSDFDVLVQLAEDSTQSSYRRRQAVSDLLKDYSDDDKTISILGTLLAGSDVHLKRDLLGALKNCSSPRILPLVKPLLNEADDYLRRDIIQLMGKLGTKAELVILEPLCDDDSFSVNYAAKQAIKDIESRISQAQAEPEVELEAKPEPEAAGEPEAAPELETKPEPEVVSVPHSSSEVDEILPEKQKLPNSLHDNSIFKDRSVAEVSRELSDSLSNEFSSGIPLLSSLSHPEKSRNLKSFFGEEYQLGLALYRQLAVSSTELPVKENAVSECRHRLTLLEADKEDDLAASTESIAESLKDKEGKQWDLRKAELAIANLEKENKELLTSILFVFSSSKKEKALEKKAKLKKQLLALKKEISTEDDELQGLLAEKKSIKDPLFFLRQELNQCEVDRDLVLEKVYKTECEINQLVLKVLLTFEEKVFEQRLEFLDTVNSPVARKISKRIFRLKNSLLAAQKKQEELEQSNNALVKMDNLGLELTKSLTLKGASKNESVNIKASLSFKEEKNFFGFSNASGSASGQGKATATMKVEQLEWQESPNLKMAINEFSAEFEALGNLSARQECSSIDILTTETAIRHYIDYIRCAMESDFGAE